MSYRCTSCGYQSSKWMGFCPQCKVTDALEEVARTSKRRPTSEPVPLSKVESHLRSAFGLASPSSIGCSAAAWWPEASSW